MVYRFRILRSQSWIESANISNDFISLIQNAARYENPDYSSPLSAIVSSQ